MATVLSTVEFDREAHPELPVARARKPEPCAIVLFGGAGDLTRRKLMPALYGLEAAGWLPDATSIVGFARRELSLAAYREEMRGAVQAASGASFSAQTWERFAARLAYIVGAFEDAPAYERLCSTLGPSQNLLFYMATPPSAFGTILAHLRQTRCIRPPGQGPWSRVMVEKPFGRDYASAVALDRLLHSEFSESQIFRIDHYLGKETVQNILVFRFANAIFEPLWNRKYIDHVQITAAEEIGVEGRGSFYEEIGVLRDVVQNHLLQILALAAMEPPASGDPERIRDEKSQLIGSIRPIDPKTLGQSLVLGQYRGYRSEPAVAADSRTPTFAALKLSIDNWRWHGVPFYLRAGKKLARKVTEVAIHFQGIPVVLFGEGVDTQEIQPNVLTLRIQPDEGITMRFATKVPGPDLHVGAATMDFRYRTTFGAELVDAYQRILLDGMRGDPALFAREDAVEQSWKIITPLLDAAQSLPVTLYEPGSWGPEACAGLTCAEGRKWRNG